MKLWSLGHGSRCQALVELACCRSVPLLCNEQSLQLQIHCQLAKLRVNTSVQSCAFHLQAPVSCVMLCGKL